MSRNIVLSKFSSVASGNYWINGGEKSQIKSGLEGEGFWDTSIPLGKSGYEK